MRLQEESRFVFVPGPGDPGPSSVLPRPALPSFVTSDLRQLLPSAIFASNPCRLRLYTQQVGLFRNDLQNHMRRLCLIPPTSKATPLALCLVAFTPVLQAHRCCTTAQSCQSQIATPFSPLLDANGCASWICLTPAKGLRGHLTLRGVGACRQYRADCIICRCSLSAPMCDSVTAVTSVPGTSRHTASLLAV